jgi:hypothetical protein
VFAVLQYEYEARNILSIWDDVFKLKDDKARQEIGSIAAQFLQARRPLTLRQAQCRTYMVIFKAWGDPVINKDKTRNLPAVPKNIEPDLQAIIDDWNAAVEDGTSEVTTMVHNTEGIVRPEYIPAEVWNKIPEQQLAAVRSRWEKYTEERRAFIQDDVDKMDICPERPQQKAYVRAMCWANVNAFLQLGTKRTADHAASRRNEGTNTAATLGRQATWTTLPPIQCRTTILFQDGTPKILHFRTTS